MGETGIKQATTSDTLLQELAGLREKVARALDQSDGITYRLTGEKVERGKTVEEKKEPVGAIATAIYVTGTTKQLVDLLLENLQILLKAV